jgi:hypothetical protein
VLVHSRKCDTRTYGVPGQVWLRDDADRQNAVWYAIDSAAKSDLRISLEPVACSSRSPIVVVVCSSSFGSEYATETVQTIRSWFQSSRLNVKEAIDDSSKWNFEITVNGILLHSRNLLGHGFFHDEWSQQTLVWRAISDLLEGSGRTSLGPWTSVMKALDER